MVILNIAVFEEKKPIAGHCFDQSQVYPSYIFLGSGQQFWGSFSYLTKVPCFWVKIWSKLISFGQFSGMVTYVSLFIVS